LNGSVAKQRYSDHFAEHIPLASVHPMVDTSCCN